MKFVKKIDVWLIFALFSAVILFPQINQHALILGDDSLFHMNRFYDAMMQLKSGNLQYFISMYGFSQSARVVNALYSPYVAYFNGFIMIITGSWFKYQLISDWIVNFIGAGTMYYLLRTNKVYKAYAIWISLVYVITYTLTWSAGQQFVAWGAAILPLTIAAGVRMIREKNDPVHVLELTLGVTLLVQVHVLSTLLMLIILIVFFLWGLVITEQPKKLIQKTILSAVFTLVLTSNVWGGIIELYGSNHLLTPFKNIDPFHYGTVSLDFNNLQLSTFIAILLFLQCMLALTPSNNMSKLNKGITIFGSILFIASTQLLPWNQIFKKFEIISVIQFPKRFLPFAIALLLLGLGLSFTQILSKRWTRKPDYILILLGVFVLMSTAVVMKKLSDTAAIWQTDRVIASHSNVKQLLYGSQLRDTFAAGKDMGDALKIVYRPTSDYVPIPNRKKIPEHPYNEYDLAIFQKEKEFRKKVSRNSLSITWKSTHETIKKISVFKYKHTNLKLNGRKLTSKQYVLNDIGTVSVHSKRGYNELLVNYKPAQWFNILLVINWITWIVVSIIYMKWIFIKIKSKGTVK
ncbi:hypothetical protein [Leuconostoc carnosum]|uniref:hypothetical protein n=1 Tax=Leuconostoc carnosum TaxID=1252 RepID=UPI00345E5CA0